MADAITLDDMLRARDARALRQAETLAAHPDDSLVVLTIVAPGPVKRSRASRVAAEAACRAIAEAFDGYLTSDLRLDLPTGFEAFFTVSLSAEEAKHRAVAIEDSHPLGRLFDIDVMGADLRPISRSETGGSPRRCLLCDNDARVCMRTGAHSYAELISHIDRITSRYDDSEL